MRETFIDELRRATRVQHAKLDDSLSFSPESVTLQRYVTFLDAMLSVVAPLEARLTEHQAFRSALTDWPERRRVRLLVDDLSYLRAQGFVPQATYGGGARAGESDTSVLPTLETPGAAFGAAYVLEGSTLGGVHLARTLGPQLGLDSAHGMSFWTAHGAQTGERFRSFVSALQQFAGAATSSERAALLETACGVFAGFQRALDTRGLTQVLGRGAA